MNRTILSVPVLADSNMALPKPRHRETSQDELVESEMTQREARESTPRNRSYSGESLRDSRGGQKLFVSREGSRFFFYAVRGTEITERVTARSASLIWDYLEANWPPGTRVYWIIL